MSDGTTYKLMLDEPDSIGPEQALASLKGEIASTEVAFETVPPVAHPINRGLGGTSVSIRRRTDGSTWFLKVLSRRPLDAVNFADARTAARNAAELGIAPRLLASNSETGALLFEHLPENYEFGTVKAFRNRELCQRAIGCMKKLHGTEKLSSSVSVFERINLLQNKLVAFDATRGGQGSAYRESYQAMLDCVRQAEQAIAAASQDSVPCRGENSLSNFMVEMTGGLMLVDFDLATNADPFADLGNFCNEICRTDRDVEGLVEEYCGRVREADLARVKLYMIASAFHLGLWGVVSQYRQPETEIEFYKYGQNQFVRCLAAVERWDVGSLCRML